MFLPHAGGIALLRKRSAPGERPVARSYNLIGLATATIGFLAAGGTALTLALERYVVEGGGVVDKPLPAEPLAFALILLPLSMWFAYRLWQEFIQEQAQGSPREELTPVSGT